MKISLIYILLFFVAPLSATQQIEETFIVGDETFGLEMGPGDKSPLDSLYSSDEIYLMLKSKGTCTANWRGYKGTWEIKNNELYLNSLVKEACSQNPPLVDPILFFDKKNYPVKARWFDGIINVRQSPNTYKYCKSSEGKDEMIGYEYEAIVYEFSAGDFIFKSKQTLNQVWARSLTNCAK